MINVAAIPKNRKLCSQKILFTPSTFPISEVDRDVIKKRAIIIVKCNHCRRLELHFTEYQENKKSNNVGAIKTMVGPSVRELNTRTNVVDIAKSIA